MRVYQASVINEVTQQLQRGLSTVLLHLEFTYNYIHS